MDPEVKVQCVERYVEFKFPIAVKRWFIRIFNMNPPSDNTIKAWNAKL